MVWVYGSVFASHSCSVHDQFLGLLAKAWCFMSLSAGEGGVTLRISQAEVCVSGAAVLATLRTSCPVKASGM